MIGPLTKSVLARFDDQQQELVRRTVTQQITELQVGLLGLIGSVVAVQELIKTGAYTPTLGAKRGFLVQCAGGGAGGGATAGAGVVSIGGGGASGVTAVHYLNSLGSGGPVTIGAGGTAGAPGAAGNAGGDTTTVINGKTRLSRGGGGGGAGSQSGNPAGVNGMGGIVQLGSTPGLWWTADYGLDGLITSASGGGAGAGNRAGSGALGLQGEGFGAGGGGGFAVNGSSAGAPGQPGKIIVIELT